MSGQPRAPSDYIFNRLQKKEGLSILLFIFFYFLIEREYCHSGPIFILFGPDDGSDSKKYKLLTFYYYNLNNNTYVLIIFL